LSAADVVYVVTRKIPLSLMVIA